MRTRMTIAVAAALLAMAAAPPPAAAHAQADRSPPTVVAAQSPPAVDLALVQLASDSSYDIAGACLVGVISNDIAEVIHVSLGQACKSIAAIGRLTRIQGSRETCIPSELDLTLFVRSRYPVHAFLCSDGFVLQARTSQLISRYGAGARGRT